MNYLLDKVGDDEKHPDFDFLELISSLVESYEATNVLIRDASPAEVLAYLMQEHDLIQNDLRTVFGSLSVVSKVLNGRRNITPAQAKALGQTFGVSPAVFL